MPKFTWTPEDPAFNYEKKNLLEYYIQKNYANLQLCINAFERVARSLYVPAGQKRYSYNDRPLSIGFGQTISAPHMAFMECEALEIQTGDVVLEIGSGSGYHASIVAEMCAPSNVTPPDWRALTQHYDDSSNPYEQNSPGKVITIERLEALVTFAQRNIKRAGYADRIEVIHGDGTEGYETKAPYDKIMVTAAAPNIPEKLKKQLKIGGKLIIPVGARNFYQELLLLERISETDWLKKSIGGVVFVPLIGKYAWPS